MSGNEEITDLRQANHDLHIEKAHLLAKIAELEARVSDLGKKWRDLLLALDQIEGIAEQAQQT